MLEGEGLTKEEILEKYPLRTEFVGAGHMPRISRNEDGVILYVEPGWATKRKAVVEEGKTNG